jgi:hypothetical protein
MAEALAEGAPGEAHGDADAFVPRFFEVSFGPPWVRTLTCPLLGLLLAVSCLAVAGSRSDSAFGCTCVLLSAGIALVPLAVRAGYSALVEWGRCIPHFVAPSHRAQAVAWLSRAREPFARRRWYGAIGLLGGAAGTASYLASGFFTRVASGNEAPAAVAVFLGAFFGAVGLAHVAHFARIVHGLGRFPIRVDGDRLGVLSSGRVLAAVYGMACGVLFVFSLSASSGMPRRWIPLAACALPAWLFIVSSFVAAQVPLHRRMLEYKEGAVGRLRALRDAIEEAALQPGAAVDRERLVFLEDRIARIEALPDWPFSGAVLARVMGFAAGAIAPLALDLIASRLIVAT